MYDLIVIGAGSGGLTGAEFATNLGAKVALVEKHRVGGDCTWTGCVPSKALLKVAKVAQSVRTADHFGITSGMVQVDMGRVRDYVNSAIAEIYQHETPERLQAKGIEVFLGAARFVDERTIEVNGRHLQAKHFLITTGAQPIVPPISGLHEVPFVTYEQVFGNERLPEHLVIVGAGAVGVEIGQAYGRLGSKVTLIDKVGLLPEIDVEAGRVVDQVLAAEGVRFVLGEVTAVSHENGDIYVNLKDGTTIKGDMLLVAVGRRPNVAGLDLEKAGVIYSLQGIQVDKQLQTNVKHILAAGDCVGGPQFTHYAGWQAYKAVRNALLPGNESGFTSVLPWTLFTDPEVAGIGLTETKAREMYGEEIRVAKRPLTHVDRAVTDNQQAGFIKIVHLPKGKILGATIVAPRAGEMITEFAVAKQHDLSLDDLAQTIHVYPSYGMGVQRLAAEVAMQRFLTSSLGKVLRRFI